MVSKDQIEKDKNKIFSDLTARNLRIDFMKEAIRKLREQQPWEDKAKAEARAVRAVGPDGRPYWDKVKESAVDMQSKVNAGYNTWAIAMMELFLALQDLANAMEADPIDIIGLVDNILPFKDERDCIIGLAVILPIDSVKELVSRVPKLGDFPIIRNILFNNSDLPIITASVKLDAQGHIQSTVMQNSEPVTEYQQAIFDAVVVAWAEAQGFTFSDQNGIGFLSENNRVMTNERFQELMNQPENDLVTYIKEQCKIDIQLASGSAPSP